MTEQSTKKIFTVGTLTYTSASLAILFFWLLWGDLSWALKGRSVGAIATLMVKKFGITNYLYGLLIVSIPNFTNIFLIPWISYKSDRHRGPYGRRIPYLFMTTPIVVLALLGLGMTPFLGTHLAALDIFSGFDANKICLVIFAVFWLLLDLGTTLSVNIYAALANDVVPQQFIGRFQAMSRALSLAIAMYFNASLMGKAETDGPKLLIYIGILYAVGLFSLCAFVKEGEYPPPPQETEHLNPVMNVFKMIKNYGRICFTIPYYRWLFIGSTLGALGSVPFNTYYIFFAKSMNVDMDTVGKFQAICFGVSFFLSFFLGGLSDKFHPLRTSIISLIITGLVNLFGGFYCNSYKMFLAMQLMHGITVMSYNTLSASLPARLFPRLHFAQFNSALMLLTSIATMLVVPLLGKILDLTGQKYFIVYLAGALFEFGSVIIFLIVYKYFKQYGGDSNYKAPLPDNIS